MDYRAEVAEFRDKHGLLEEDMNLIEQICVETNGKILTITTKKGNSNGNS